MNAPGAFHRPPRSFPPAMPAEKIVIARPPALARRATGFAQMLLPVLGTLGIVAFAVIMPGKLFLIVAGAFIAIALVSVGVSFWSQRRTGRRSARTERRLYRAHLAEREERLEDACTRQREIDERLYPEPDRLAGVAVHRRFLWERRPGDSDFLAFRLGRAAVPLACPVELDLSDDPLTEYQPELLLQAQRLIDSYRTVEQLSVVESLAGASVITLTGARDRTASLARALLAQAATLRAPSDLRIMASFDAAADRAWGWLKWLPHARAGVRSDAGGPAAGPSLLVAPGGEDLQRLLERYVQPRLEQLRRIESAGVDGARPSIDAPELLVVLDGFDAGGDIARLPLVRELAARGRQLKVRTICLVPPESAEPPEAELRIVVDPDGRGTLERTGAAGYRVGPFELDGLSTANADRLARELAPLRLDEGAAGIDLAAEVRLGSLLKDPAGELCAPIGVSDDGDRLVLDLKQAAEGGMGPHGLIVGATGSGKSELLRTIVASLAASHPPDELCFVFVDFKGGAAFAELAGLPHSAGMITNLQHDLSLIDRMHDALFGEMQRRQSLLRDAGNVDDLLAYRTRRSVDPSLPPLPHLLLIVDEFGELLANRPEFIELFLAIGRVGRSLGMHLLLSSQRLEEGRLRGLEGHLRYRICLRTYSSQESKTVLGTPDAFLLPPYPGVGYLSVDTDVYRRFKTALVTTPHREHAAHRRGPVVEAFELRPARTDWGVREVGAGATELDVLVARLRDAERDRRGVHQVWLPPLPERQPLSEVLDAAPWSERGRAVPGPLGPRACVGLLDRPSEQRQDPFWVDLSGGGGHLAIIGAPQTGKSTALRTLLASLFLNHTPDELRAYVIDFGGGLLRSLEQAPHLGGVAGKADPERVQATVRQVRALIDEREACFRRLGIDSMADARLAGRDGRLASQYSADVLLVIDNWAALIRDHEQLTDELAEIAAAGLHHGVHLIVGAGRWAELRAAVREAFGTRLELRLNDPMESDFGRKTAETLVGAPPGRGVTPDGLHFQIALPRLDGRAEPEALGRAAAELTAELRRRWAGPDAPAVRVLPEHVELEALPAAYDGGLAIALEELTLAPVALDLDGAEQHLLALGDSGSGRTTLLRTIAHAIAARYTPEEASLYLVDFRRSLTDLAELPLPSKLASRPPQVERMLAELRELTAARLRELDRQPPGTRASGPAIFILVDDYDLVSGTAMNPLGGLAELISQGRDAGIHVVLARAAGGAARAMLDPVLSRLIESGAPALLLSGDPHEGPLVRGARAEPMPPGRARLLRRQGRPVLVQLAKAPVAARTTNTNTPTEEEAHAVVSGSQPR